MNPMTKKTALAATLCSLWIAACGPAAQPPPAAPIDGNQATGACQPADCGPIAEIARICDDQSIGVPRCGRAADGACRWEHVCPGTRPTGDQAASPQPAASPAGAPAAGQEALAGAPDRALVDGNSAFAQALYGRLAAAPGNLFFSPASISTALAMTYPGARGETAAQMARTLHFTLPPADLHPAFRALLTRMQGADKGAPEIRIANRLWGQSGMPVEAGFLQVTKDHYGAAMELVDFQAAPEPARAKINLWASDQTKGKILDVLPQGTITPATRLVLANAIYFKGTWATQFDKKATKTEPFTVKPGTTAQAPMMHATLRTGFGVTPDASVLELPYAGRSATRALSLVVILPKAVDGLPKVEQEIAAGRLGGYLRVVSNGEVVVSLPRFKMTSAHNLSGTLAALGMPDAFSEKKADLSGISKAERLYISRVQHKAFVDVNEEGTEAAAVTAVVTTFVTQAVAPEPRVFRADHPFAFLIRDTLSGTILFMGRVTNPT